jgi:hypothetical protein
MKHYIDARPGSPEFREAFAQIRDSFIQQLIDLCATDLNARFYVCNERGKEMKWVWDQETFRPVGLVGSLNDANSYLAHMINQGMCVAFIGVRDESGLAVWLTAFEEPGPPPRWPDVGPALFEEIHEGVFIGREDQGQ